MDTVQAAALINEKMVFKAGWKIKATPYDDVVVVDIQDNHPDSSNPPNYPTYRGDGAHSVEYLYPSHMSVAEVAERVFEWCVSHDIHEWREFFRVDVGKHHGDRRYYAPYHPHTSTGTSNFNEAFEFNRKFPE